MQVNTTVSENLGVPKTDLPRVIIVGGGFGGLQAAKKLRNKNVQLVLIDKNNYYQFQPLFYQVAMSGIEPSSVVFPFRKVFSKVSNVHVRNTTALKIDTQKNILITSAGNISYDYLLMAMGTKTNYFGNPEIEKYSVGMKTVSESLYLRNCVLEILEHAVLGLRSINDVHIAIIGGGPTGVELSGALAEMKKHVFPKEYPELDFTKMKIVLFEGTNRLLAGMHEKSSDRAKQYLTQLGVELHLNVLVKGANHDYLELSDGSRLPFGLIIWAAGVSPVAIEGIPETSVSPNKRIKTNSYLQVLESTNVYCIGDQAFVEDPLWPKGHPQMAQAAIQQGELFANNLLRQLRHQSTLPFRFKDRGSMATVGRNLAVVEIGKFKIGGFIAWLIWMAVHLMSILGVKNKLFIFINWVWSYITYNQSLRLLIKPFKK